MTSSRRDTEENLAEARKAFGTSEQAEPVAEQPKKLSALDEALKLRSELSDINKREKKAAANMAARYEAERRELLAGASQKAMAILEAAGEEE